MRKKETIHNPSWFKKGVYKTPWNKGRKSPQSSGELNPIWKGNKVGYRQLHKWVRSRKPLPKNCENCSANKKLQLSNIGKKYTRDLSNWEYLCASCHVRKDGTINNLKNVGLARKLSLSTGKPEAVLGLNLDFSPVILNLQKRVKALEEWALKQADFKFEIT